MRLYWESYFPFTKNYKHSLKKAWNYPLPRKRLWKALAMKRKPHAIRREVLPIALGL